MEPTIGNFVGLGGLLILLADRLWGAAKGQGVNNERFAILEGRIKAVEKDDSRLDGYEQVQAQHTTEIALLKQSMDENTNSMRQVVALLQKIANK